jgi:hypothetical protein
MKKRILIILAALITLTICLTGCFNKADPKKVDLGERYDSDKIVKFSPDATYTDNYQEKFGEVYESYLEAASETQFVVHENTAIAIAEAVIKEIYPDEIYQIINLSSYPKALYYEAGNCWEVWLFTGNSPKPIDAIRVYVDVNSGAVNAIIPSTEF